MPNIQYAQPFNIHPKDMENLQDILTSKQLGLEPIGASGRGGSRQLRGHHR